MREGDAAARCRRLTGDPASATGAARRAATSQRRAGLCSATGKVERLGSRRASREQPVHEGDFEYAGVDDHYFMTAALDPGPAKITFQPVSHSAAGGSNAGRAHVGCATRIEPGGDDAEVLRRPEGLRRARARRSRAGARDRLRHVRRHRRAAAASLKWINGFVGNYGWSIIILTIIINALMFPLRHKSVVSMRKMQEIQPEVKAIQDRYAKLKATDPAKQKMNQELMALYRERGVNPASGCMPMLLTLPVLLAFYSLLTTAIELRGAPFFGWIHDLSAPDPYLRHAGPDGRHVSSGSSG